MTKVQAGRGLELLGARTVCVIGTVTVDETRGQALDSERLEPGGVGVRPSAIERRDERAETVQSHLNPLSVRVEPYAIALVDPEHHLPRGLWNDDDVPPRPSAFEEAVNVCVCHGPVPTQPRLLIRRELAVESYAKPCALSLENTYELIQSCCDDCAKPL